MNDDEWLNGTDPFALLGTRYEVHTHGSVEPQDRLSRTYAVACARRPAVWGRLPAVSRVLVDLAEEFVDARGSGRAREAVGQIALRLMNGDGEDEDLTEAAANLNRFLAAAGRPVRDLSARPDVPADSDEWRGLAALVYLPFDAHTPNFRWVPREYHSADLVREVFGYPHRRIRFDPQWRTTTVLTLARGIYDRSEFASLPILADALQDTGCAEEDILAHCRDPNRVHVRGCWVLRMVLNLR
jgi:hypothetical protein